MLAKKGTQKGKRPVKEMQSEAQVSLRCLSIRTKMRKKSENVPCPACNTFVPLKSINEHLDKYCGQEGQETAITETRFKQEKRKRENIIVIDDNCDDDDKSHNKKQGLL